MTDKTNLNNANYYGIIQKHLQNMYPDISKNETVALCREVVFAPNTYTTEINHSPIEISSVRKGLADFIEQQTANKDFIPYSLQAEIANLIEENNCETSSMNEYYRWISMTAEIVQRTTDGEVTHSDYKIRKNFIDMSWDREAELLLCLSLYEASGNKYQGKCDLMLFKLARLREMRSIVRNTPQKITTPKEHMRLQAYYKHCLRLLAEKEKYVADINYNLKLNINHSNDEDLNANFSHLDYIRSAILNLMRQLEENSEQRQRLKKAQKQIDATAKKMPQALETKPQMLIRENLELER